MSSNHAQLPAGAHTRSTTLLSCARSSTATAFSWTWMVTCCCHGRPPQLLAIGSAYLASTAAPAPAAAAARRGRALAAGARGPVCLGRGLSASAALAGRRPNNFVTLLRARRVRGRMDASHLVFGALRRLMVNTCLACGCLRIAVHRRRYDTRDGKGGAHGMGA